MYTCSNFDDLLSVVRKTQAKICSLIRPRSFRKTWNSKRLIRNPRPTSVSSLLPKWKALDFGSTLMAGRRVTISGRMLIPSLSSLSTGVQITTKFYILHEVRPLIPICAYVVYVRGSATKIYENCSITHLLQFHHIPTIAQKREQRLYGNHFVAIVTTALLLFDQIYPLFRDTSFFHLQKVSQSII